jgi:hypothetical protein
MDAAAAAAKETEKRRRPLPLAYAMEGEEVEERLILKPHLSGPRLDLTQANQVMLQQQQQHLLKL